MAKQQGLGWRVTATAVAAASLLGHAGAAAAAPEDPADPADEAEDAQEAEDAEAAAAAAREAELAAVRQALAAARDALAQARAAGRAADGQVRRAEGQLAPAIEDRWAAEDRLADAELDVEAATARLERAVARVRDLRAQRTEARNDLEVARRQLEDRVVRAYKTGSLAAESTLALTIVREASSPGELATAVKQLETVMLAGADRVDDVLARLARLETELDEAIARRRAATRRLDEARDEVAAAQDALEAAVAAVDTAEETAAARRRAADDAEARLLASLHRALDREATVARAAVDLAEVTGDGEEADGAADAAGGPDAAGEASATLADRFDWLARRQRALARAWSVPAEDRRTADTWACPVEGGAFVNDWGFPRTGDRRHEGTDVFAPEGTPVVAPADGVVSRLDARDRFDGRRDLGGITVSIEQGRHRWYHAHLSGIHPDLAVGDEVEAGQVIGWVGRTGNARGTPPHLHFGWYVDGVAVNPYASLVLACRSEARAG